MVAFWLMWRLISRQRHMPVTVLPPLLSLTVNELKWGFGTLEDGQMQSIEMIYPLETDSANRRVFYDPPFKSVSSDNVEHPYNAVCVDGSYECTVTEAYAQLTATLDIIKKHSDAGEGEHAAELTKELLGKGFGTVNGLEDLCRMVRTFADRPVMLGMQKSMRRADGFWTPVIDQEGRIDVARIVSELTGTPWLRDVDHIVSHIEVTSEDGQPVNTLLLVRWAGYDDGHNSWLNIDDVRPSDVERYFSGEPMQLHDIFDIVGSVEYGHDLTPTVESKGKGKSGRKSVCAPPLPQVKRDNDSSDDDPGTSTGPPAAPAATNVTGQSSSDGADADIQSGGTSASGSSGAAQVDDDDAWQHVWMQAFDRWERRFEWQVPKFSTDELVESAQAMRRRVVQRVVARHHLSTAIDRCAPYGLQQVATRTVCAGIRRRGTKMPEPSVAIDVVVGDDGARWLQLSVHEQGTDPKDAVPALAVSLNDPRHIHIEALPDMSEAQGETFQQGAARYCAAVGQMFSLDDPKVVEQEQRLEQLRARDGHPLWEWSETVSPRMLSRCVQAAKWTAIEKFAANRRHLQRVTPIGGHTVTHPYEATPCVVDSGAVGSDFWDHAFVRFKKWGIDTSVNEEITMANNQVNFNTVAELEGQPTITLVRDDRKAIEVKVAPKGSVADLGGGVRPDGRPRVGHNLLSTDANIRPPPDGNGWIIVHAWSTEHEVPRLISSMIDMEGNVFPLVWGPGNQSCYPVPGTVIKMPSEGIGNGEWLYKELERRKRVRHGLPPLTEAEQSVSRKEARRAGRAAWCLALYPSETSSEESLSSSCADGWETTSQGDSDEEATDADDEVGAPARGVSAAAVGVKTQLFTDEQAQQIRV